MSQERPHVPSCSKLCSVFSKFLQLFIAPFIEKTEWCLLWLGTRGHSWLMIFKLKLYLNYFRIVKYISLLDKHQLWKVLQMNRNWYSCSIVPPDSLKTGSESKRNILECKLNVTFEMFVYNKIVMILCEIMIKQCL
jgi:hypothetical protein